MTLPTKPTPPKTDLSAFTVMLYGPPKIGKSTWASRWPDALFLATEPGLNALEVYQQPIRTWAEMLAAVKELEAGAHKFRTVVVDTVDNMHTFCSEAVCAQWKVKHPADLKYGKGWGLINSEFQRTLTRLAHLPSGLVLISHAVDREQETRTATFTKTMPTLPGKAREVVTGLADMILYCDVEPVVTDGKVTGYNRVMRTTPTATYEAGDRTGRLPEVLPLAYATFTKAFTDGGSK